MPVVIKRILQVDKDDQGNITKTIKNLSESHTSFNVKVLKELIFYCKEKVKQNLDDILQIIKLLSNQVKDDGNRTNIGMLYEKTLESFSRIRLIKFTGPNLYPAKDWENEEF